MTNVIAVEKSLSEETKKVSRPYLGESLWNNENVVAIIFIHILHLSITSQKAWFGLEARIYCEVQGARGIIQSWQKRQKVAEVRSRNQENWFTNNSKENWSVSSNRLRWVCSFVVHRQYPHNSRLAFWRENSETVLKYGNKGSQCCSKSYPWAYCPSVSKLLQWCGLRTKESQHPIESFQSMFRILEEISARFGLFQLPVPKLLTN